MPPVAMAVSMPWLPSVAKPWLEKLDPWNSTIRNAKITSMITPSFHHTATLFTRANQRTPK